jgi:hypothetical protein
MLVAMLAALVLFGAGCGGINTGTSVSPASFFLPGLLKNDAPTNAPVALPQTSTEFASVK